MYRQDQIVKHDPPNQLGDCFRTTIANLLEISVEEVPHFLHDGCEMIEALRRLNKFLRPHGLAYIQVDVLAEVLLSMGIEGLYHESCGDTVRGTYHSAAFVDGVLMHDPHPTHVGFTHVDNAKGFFVALRPWEKKVS